MESEHSGLKSIDEAQTVDLKIQLRRHIRAKNRRHPLNGFNGKSNCVPWQLIFKWFRLRLLDSNEPSSRSLRCTSIQMTRLLIQFETFPRISASMRINCGWRIVRYQAKLSQRQRRIQFRCCRKIMCSNFSVLVCIECVLIITDGLWIPYLRRVRKLFTRQF